MTMSKTSNVRAGRLEGKTAVVTAAANGIGRATTEMFVAEGARVLATDIDAEGLKSVSATSDWIETAVLDVTDSRAIAALLGGRHFDVVFNCAGWVHEGNIEACDYAEWQRSFRVNVDSMYWVCRAVLPQMVAAGRGSIVNMSSVVSSIKAAPNRFAYATTKAAVIGLTKAIAVDYIHYKIRCNAVCPGTVLTPSLRERVAAQGGSEEETWKRFADRQPMRRLGEPAEIAALAVYLASDESAFTTGAVYTVDGGWSA